MTLVTFLQCDIRVCPPGTITCSQTLIVTQKLAVVTGCTLCGVGVFTGLTLGITRLTNTLR